MQPLLIIKDSWTRNYTSLEKCTTNSLATDKRFLVEIPDFNQTVYALLLLLQKHWPDLPLFHD